jgi:shikimate kinase
MPHPLTNRPIALVGLSGAGKSSVGRGLTARLGWPLLDTDALVAQAAGCGVAQIFAEEGEARFRDLEAAALRAALESAPAIVATGAGVVLRAENRALLRARAFVVWLDAPTAALVARLRAHDEARPLLQGGDPAARLEALRAARAALYAEVADVRVETDGQGIEQICEVILLALGPAT